eukprot:CCRYP_006554-RD/>CCRYP_006554-RD protein AED:0.43 eAED:0.43 QI:221/1/1/1/0/0/2/62/62
MMSIVPRQEVQGPRTLQGKVAAGRGCGRVHHGGCCERCGIGKGKGMKQLCLVFLKSYGFLTS